MGSSLKTEDEGKVTGDESTSSVADELYGQGDPEDGQTESSEQSEAEGQEDEQLVDEALKSAGEEEDADVKSASDSGEKADESTLKTILGMEKESGQKQEDSDDRTVPLREHIKLRQRAQTAEQKLAQLEAKLAKGETLPEGETSEDILAGIPDEFLDKNQVQRVLKAERDAVLRAVKVMQQEQEQSQQQKEQERKLLDLAQRSLSAEQQFVTEHPDYPKLTKAATTLNLITDADRSAIFGSDNPAAKLYELATAKLAALRQVLGTAEPKAKKSSEPSPQKTESGGTHTSGDEEAEQSDEEIFDAVYGKPQE